MKTTMSFCQQDNIITISICGKIDGTNATDLSKVYEEIKGLEYGKLLMDVDEMPYISSAGLREILKIVKQEGNKFEVINVSSEVYEIFEMTGFTEITTTRRKLREITVDPSTEIGRGGNGIVYRLNEESIVKIYNANVTLEELENEKRCAKEAFIKGIPTAMSFDLVTSNGCYGIIYELLNVETLGNLIQNNPEQMDFYVDKYVSLMKQIQTTDNTGTSFPSVKDYYKNKLKEVNNYFSEEEVEKCYQLIDSIPDTNTLIHGDFHTKNILISGDEWMLIDMESFSYGHPIFDLLELGMVFRFVAAMRDEVSLNIIGMDTATCGKFWNKVIEKYFEDSPEQIPQMKEYIERAYHLTIMIKMVINPKLPEQMKVGIAQKCRYEFISHIDELIGKLN